jgi:ABC-type transport system involved in multi-copper enzyme maturation permease subunit
MSFLSGVVRYEYKMSIQRTGLLVIFALFTLYFLITTLTSREELLAGAAVDGNLWLTASFVMSINLFIPVVCGILASDRIVRDEKLNMRELLRTTRLTNQQYVLGKYLGVTLSEITCIFLMVLFIGISFLLIGFPVQVIPMCLLVSLAVNVPAVLFVNAFSVMFPSLMPVRIYQILFTGYWYWGNYLNAEKFFSISDTILNVAGFYPLEGYWGIVSGGPRGYTPSDALLNLLVIIVLAAAALFIEERSISSREAAV